MLKYVTFSNPDRTAIDRTLSVVVPSKRAAWEAFGADRLLFGSNWPVSDRFAPYKTVFDLAAGPVKAKGAEAFKKVFAGNAIKAYRLKMG